MAQRTSALNHAALSEDGECTGKEAVPPDVVKVVLATKVARESLREGEPLDHVEQLFKVSQIELGLRGRAGLLVCGSGDMSGADNAWYWVVATPYTHPRVVLFEGSDGIALTDHVHHGYRDIKSAWSVAAGGHDRVFRFDGHRYVLARQLCFETRRGWKRKPVSCPIYEAESLQ